MITTTKLLQKVQKRALRTFQLELSRKMSKNLQWSNKKNHLMMVQVKKMMLDSRLIQKVGHHDILTFVYTILWIRIFLGIL
ncbi:unnamed protein product [Acanthoscelides obtectus]|uniref:Uncharacterized protein n=1 Tax=Acanthoscelides obtectus TaxID=200917 RepID=A0A9P0PLU8_ACAOB|nr:unnamed protein product [Acanthoscelides obtectus]CAK1662488.1 hypothetical protein AOBTE_LOCUS23169 [Acanthoscelides obtectus]